MANYIYSADIINPISKVRVKLFLIHFQDENNIHFIFSPHLDLTGYGYNLREAKKSFNIALDDLISYTINKKTLSKLLTGLGWKIKGSGRKSSKLLAPSITSIIANNRHVSEIFDKHNAKTFHQEVEFPAMG